MRQLLLMRHAKSSWDDTSMPDKDRPLNARGREAAARMQRAIQELGLGPDLILVSTARRTLETMEALEPWDATPLVEPMDALYLADAAQILNALHAVPETVRSAMVIGHNPGMHDLALALVHGSARATSAAHRLEKGFPTAALAEFSVPGPWWQIGQRGGQLVRFLTPGSIGAGN
jgi:phosphohistidine phosphatase